MKALDTCDTTIWDNGLYRFFYYCRHISKLWLISFHLIVILIVILVFYGMLAYSSVRISSPEYYKPDKWLKK